MVDLSWDATDLDNAQSESGVVHESVPNTDHDSASVLKQGYSAESPFPNDVNVYYPMHEDSGTTVNDYSGNSNTGTNNGATVNQPALLGTTGYLFDGADDYVDVPSIFTGATEASWSFWARCDTDGTTQSPLAFDEDGEPNVSVRFHNGGTTNELTVTVPHTTTNAQVTASVDLSPLRQYTVTVVEGGTLTVKVDDSVVGTDTGSGSFSNLGGTTNNRIGSARDDTLNFSGLITEFRAVGREISDAENTTLYDVVATPGSLTTQPKTA